MVLLNSINDPISIHPTLQLLWNYWPFSMVFLTPIRILLNILFPPLNIFVWWIPLLWNLITETICFIVLTIGILILFTVVGSIIGTGFAITIAVLYGFLCITLPT